MNAVALYFILWNFSVCCISDGHKISSHVGKILGNYIDISLCIS
jgi:hypothetical protein